MAVRKRTFEEKVIVANIQEWCKVAGIRERCYWKYKAMYPECPKPPCFKTAITAFMQDYDLPRPAGARPSRVRKAVVDMMQNTDLTQRQIAETLHITQQAVSKHWTAHHKARDRRHARLSTKGVKPWPKGKHRKRPKLKAHG